MAVESLSSLRGVSLNDSGYFAPMPEETRVVIGWSAWLLPCCGPTLVCGVAAMIFSATTYQAWLPAAITLGGCAVGVLLSMVWCQRQAAAAESLMRRADLLDIDLPRTGMFHGLVHAGTHQIRRVTAEARRATDQRTRSEAIRTCFAISCGDSNRRWSSWDNPRSSSMPMNRWFITTPTPGR